MSSYPYMVNDDIFQRKGGRALSREETGRECAGVRAKAGRYVGPYHAQFAVSLTDRTVNLQHDQKFEILRSPESSRFTALIRACTLRLLKVP